MNEDQREVLEFTHFQGLTQTEIAEKIHKPLGTVKSLVRSALKVLRTSAVEAGGRHDDIEIEYTDLCELYALGALDGEERWNLNAISRAVRIAGKGLAQAIELNEMIFSATTIASSPARNCGVACSPASAKANSPRRAFNWALALAAAAA